MDPQGLIEDDDMCIFFNFRADRARQLTMALSHPHFSEFKREKFPRLSSFLTMTTYHKEYKTPVIFPPQHFTHVLGEVLSQEGIAQLRIAETEKYAHVTFFFNGGEEKVFGGEERILIPSKRDIRTYDLNPEMSAPELTNTVIKNIQKNEFGFILLNFANADMVGHTGNLKATIKAIEVLDNAISKIMPALQSHQGHLFITADHGNAEQMIDPKTKTIHTAHTTNPVPLYYIPPDLKRVPLANGILADVAPTLLKVLNIAQPKEMTGRSLC